MVHVLADDTRILIRPIRPSDKLRLAAGMAQLSPESIRRRFLTAKPSLSKDELRYLTEVDGVRHVALVAVPADEPERIVGVARWVRPTPAATSAEFAMVVADELQGQGLGTMLLRELAATATAAGVRRFSAIMLADNRAVLRLLEAFSPRVVHTFLGSGLQEVVAELPPAAHAA